MPYARSLDRLWRGATIAVCASLILTLPAAAATEPVRPQQEPVFLPLVNAPGGASAAQDVTRELDTFETSPPSPELAAAIEAFKLEDPDASFSFFNGHVDSFATRPKPTIPDYAQSVLAGMGISLTAVIPDLFPDPAESPKLAQNLDSNPNLRFPWSVEAFTTTPVTPDPEDGDTNQGDPTPSTPPLELREITASPLEPRDDSWTQPSDRVRDRLAPAAEPILAAFLAKHPNIFELLPASVGPDMPSLNLQFFHMGRFYQMARFGQTYKGYPVLAADLSLLFDANWNVIGLSRMIVDPPKLPIDETILVARDQALETARAAAAAFSGKPAGEWSVVEFVLGVDPLRRQFVYSVNLVIPAAPENDVTVTIDARSGLVLNIASNVEAFYGEDANGDPELLAYTVAQADDGAPVAPDLPVYGPQPDNSDQVDAVAYTDAKVRRWAYTNGDVRQPFQVTTSNVYVRDDNTLTHDFFYSANDQRTNGTLSACADQGNKTTWPTAAWGAFNSSTYIRHTHRSDRNFSLWSPGDASGTFAESDNYFWSRAFFQWLKPALKELGVLPSSAANYPKLLMVTNACIDDIGYASGSGLAVTVQHNEGEGSRKVRIADACRAGNAGCAASDYSAGKGGHYASCDGTGCMATPSIIHHEINHYILAQFFGVGSSIDCSTGNQLGFLHEGTMGSVIPSAFWHHYYGVGYAPADTDRLFTSDEVRGRVHVSNATLLTVGGWKCSEHTSVTATDKGPYNAGRVSGQMLWKIYHGIKVSGSTQSNMWRTSTDTDFLILTYWASDLVASSTYKDRYEMANRVMEILDKYSNWSSSAKATYCTEWDKHGLRTYINNDYCS